MQHKPRFSGIIIAAVLMVAALVMISSYSSLFASSKSTMMLSEAMGYFESNQVTYFNLDLNTGVIEMSVKEGEHPLPESGTSSETSNGLLAEIYGDGTDAYAPKNGGAAVITYKLPYPSYFLQFYLKDYIDQYNAANPDAPMQYDMVAVKTNVPWFEIILYAFMIGSVVLLFMSMYRGGAGGGGLMNVGRAKVKDQQEGQRKATFADVAGADEDKAPGSGSVPESTGKVQLPGGAHSPRRSACRPSGHRQNAAGPCLCRRGRRSVLCHLRFRLCGNVCRRRRIPCARFV